MTKSAKKIYKAVFKISTPSGVKQNKSAAF